MQRRAERRRVDGILLLDKPSGVGSTAVLQHVRRLYAAESAGHTGTLDPMASGLLVVCFGEATKFAGELLDSGKEYDATLLLGVRTTTGDAEGEVLERREVTVSDEAIAAALERFRGDIEQIPPMHSALKRDGRPLYDYARRGETVERQPRTVRISRLENLGRDGERLRIRVSCSKGTYMRTLAEDLGNVVGCGAHLCVLRRTAVGRFQVGDAHTPDAIGLLDRVGRDGLLQPIDQALIDRPACTLDAAFTRRFTQGQALQIANVPEGLARVYSSDGRFLGTGWGAAGRLQPRRLVASAPAA
jgi:tRNA pseudouridine55 synthase